MAFTYDLSTDRGRVRVRIGDTEEHNWSLTDDEVDETLSIYSDVNVAAVLAHEWLMAKLADFITSVAGGQTSNFQQRYDQHERHHKRLVARASRVGMNCYAGGIEQTRIDDAKDDTEYPQPFSEIGQMDRDADVSAKPGNDD